MDIKSVIKKKGYTIQQVADMTGVNRVTLTLTLQGNPTYRKMKEIADAIGCHITEFFADEMPEEETTPSSFVCPKCGAHLTAHLTCEDE